MARWTQGRGTLWRKNNNFVALETEDPDVTESMIQWTDTQDKEDYYLRPALRFAVSEEKRQDRGVAIMTFVAALLLIASGSGIIYLVTRTYEAPCTVCDSVQHAMDANVDPCQDFYQFSCGNWETNIQVPEGHSKWGSFSQVYSQNQEILRKVLEEESYMYKGKQSDALRKAKDLYKACMNETAIELAGSLPLKQFLNRLGGWSVVPPGNHGLISWNETLFNLTQTITAIHLLGTAPFFDMFLAPDEKNSSNNVIQFYQNGVGFAATELYTDNDTTHEEAYTSLGAKVVVLLSCAEGEVVDIDHITEHPNYAPALQRLNDIIEFEANISAIYVSKKDLTDPEKTYKKMKLRNFSAIIPEIDMSAFLDEMFATHISLDEDVLIPTYAYFVKLSGLLKVTDRRLLADYLTWTAMKPMLKYLPQVYQDIIKQYNRVFGGSNTSLPLWEKCVQRTDRDLGFITGALFVREVATPQLRNQTQDLIEYIQDAFIENLPDVAWMDNKTREAAREKAIAVSRKIGFPTWIEDPDELDEYYQNLTITASSCFENALNLKAYYLQGMRDDLHQAVDRTEWHMVPAEVNAYYTASFNEIVFPLGILQPPFYESLHPMSMNFGAIGMVMGHELTHGFDNHGREFDKDGNLRDWWGNASAQAYKNKTECMVRQYSNYKIGDSNVDGEYTLDENIADNGGLKLAYQAYQRWQQSHNDSMGELSRLGLTQDQLFFLGFSQVWCTFVTPKNAELAIYTDTHSAENHRVNGAVSNMPEFADIFNCPLDSPMNPSKKCKVW